MQHLHDSASESLAATSSASHSAPGSRAADALSDVLRSVRLTSALFFLWDVTWPFAMPIPAGRSFAAIVQPRAQEIISYHIVTAGNCWAALIGGPPVPLEAGDILLIPHGHAYVIANSEQGCRRAQLDTDTALSFFRQMAAGELSFVVQDGGAEETATHFVCGFLGCDFRPFNPVLSELPPLVRVRAPAHAGPDALQVLIDYTLVEAREPRAGSECVLVRLSELLFVEVVRRYLAEDKNLGAGWLGALRDPVAGRALMALHRNPSAPWTLDSLAEETHVSRSRLAECFTRFVGEPPMKYLARWRMQLASGLLAEGSTKVAVVARNVGYESEAAFSRAFKRLVGVSPAQWRRAARSGDAGPL